MVKEKNTQNQKTVLLDVDRRGVATITFNRPKKHNAIDEQFIVLLSQILETVKNSSHIRVVVLEAKGKNFSAGADLHWMKNSAKYGLTENIEDALTLAELLYALNTLPVPTIALSQGFACGGALGFLSCCDVVLVNPDSYFAFTEVKIGLIPAVISPYVIAAIGERQARRYFLSGELFDADRACQIGLASEVVRSGSLRDAAEVSIEGFLANGPAAMSEAKRLISSVSNQAIDLTLVEKTAEWIAKVRISEEGQEGLSSFFEKRLPRWALASLSEKYNDTEEKTSKPNTPDKSAEKEDRRNNGGKKTDV